MQRRNTNQRQIVYNELEMLGHASTEALIENIMGKYSNISLATIYRNISILLDEGKIKKIKLRDCDVLETVKAEHFHFICEKCGEIIDLNGINKKSIYNQYKDEQIYQIKNCDISFYGICQKCIEKEKEENEVCM